VPVAFVADVHVGNHRLLGGPIEAGLNARCRATVAVLEAAALRAGKIGCSHLFILGDLFDTDRPSPQMLAAVQRAIARGPECVLLVGNHDMTSSTPGDHALAPLYHDGVIVDTTSYVEGVRLVPFNVGDAREWLPKACAGLRDGILATHVGIIDGATPPWLVAAHDAVPLTQLEELAKAHGFTHVIAGNWHEHKRWSRGGVEVIQVGALVPTGWDNPGLDGYGSIVVVADDGGVVVESLPGPRFCRAGSLAESEKLLARARKDGHRLYLRVEDGAHVPDPMPDFTFVIEGSLVSSDGAVREAAASAKDAETTTEALDAFVKAMPLADGVDRDAVLERCRGFLK